jgi:hypothetical protein
MARGRRHTAKEIVILLRLIEAETANGKEVSKACYDAGIAAPTPIGLTWTTCFKGRRLMASLF